MSNGRAVPPVLESLQSRGHCGPSRTTTSTIHHITVVNHEHPSQGVRPDKRSSFAQNSAWCLVYFDKGPRPIAKRNTSQQTTDGASPRKAAAVFLPESNNRRVKQKTFSFPVLYFSFQGRQKTNSLQEKIRLHCTMLWI